MWCPRPDLILEGALRDEICEALVRRAPEPDPVASPTTPRELLESILAWLDEHYGSDIVSVRHLANDGCVPEVRLRFHPADPGVRLSVLDLDCIRVEATTLPVGPGFRLYLGRLFGQLGLGIGIVWQSPPVISPAEASARGRTELVRWAARCLRRLQTDEGPVSLLPFDDVEYLYPGDVLTPLGPRSRAWLEAAAVDALDVIEMWSWPADGGGHAYFLGRALVLMWTRARWRVPLDNRERLVLAEIDARLAQARMTNPRVALPWMEWAEVQRHLGIRGPLADEVAARARASAIRPLVGYRYQDVRLRISEDWWIRLPGSTSPQEGESGVWASVDEGGRSMRISVLDHDKASRLPPLRRGVDTIRMTHRGEGVHGEAALRESRRGGGIFILTGRMRSGETTAVITATFHRQADRSWAERAWRSLCIRRAGWRRPRALLQG